MSWPTESEVQAELTDVLGSPATLAKLPGAYAAALAHTQRSVDAGLVDADNVDGALRHAVAILTRRLLARPGSPLGAAEFGEIAFRVSRQDPDWWALVEPWTLPGIG